LFELLFHRHRALIWRVWWVRWYDLGPRCSKLHGLCVYSNTRDATDPRFSSMDSGLEAFSRNPAHGSFSALTFQSTEFANYANQRFLSY